MSTPTLKDLITALLDVPFKPADPGPYRFEPKTALPGRRPVPLPVPVDLGKPCPKCGGEPRYLQAYRGPDGEAYVGHAGCGGRL